MYIFKRFPAVAVPICLIALGTVACSEWAPPLPSSPSALPSALDSKPSAGATIQGHVTGGSASVSPRLASVSTTLTVKIVGTNISASVSSSGAFVLEGVPAGNIQLQFTGESTNAVATLGGVNTGDRLDLQIRLAGSVGVVEASIHVKADNTTEVEGDVTAVSGSCPNLSFVVNGWTLKVDASSQSGCADIKVGVKVKIKGTLTSSKVIIIVRIEVNGRHHDHDHNDDHDSDDDDDD